MSGRPKRKFHVPNSEDLANDLVDDTCEYGILKLPCIVHPSTKITQLAGASLSVFLYSFRVSLSAYLYSNIPELSPIDGHTFQETATLIDADWCRYIYLGWDV